MEKVIFIFSVLLILSGCAMHADVLLLDDRLTYIEEHYNALDKKLQKLSAQMDDFKEKGDRKDQTFRNQYAELRAMRNKIREEIQLLNGQLEEIDYLVKKQVKTVEGTKNSEEKKIERLDNTATGNTDRIVRLEKYLGFEPSVSSGKSDLTVKSTKDQGKKKLSEKELYLYAKQTFDQGDLGISRESFQKLLDTYPKSKNADNAQFWIGEIHYREKWYEKAILEYQKVIEKYPKGNKVPAALLKQGMAFHKIGENANSRLVLNDLIRKFPKTNEAKIAKKKIKEFK